MGDFAAVSQHKHTVIAMLFQLPFYIMDHPHDETVHVERLSLQSCSCPTPFIQALTYSWTSAGAITNIASPFHDSVAPSSFFVRSFGRNTSKVTTLQYETCLRCVPYD
jgi:hypothetical protein